MTSTSVNLFYPQERLALFVDGTNLYGAAKGLQFDMDYKRLLELFAKKGTLVRAYYYTAIGDADEYTPIKPLVDWLAYNGWAVVTKAAKEFTEANGRTRSKSSMVPDMIVDIMETGGSVDHIVIASGDGDFRRAVETMQRRGRRVSILSTIKTNPVMCSDELRRQADNFIELETLKLVIARPAATQKEGQAA